MDAKRRPRLGIWPNMAARSLYYAELETDPRRAACALPDPCDNLSHGTNSQIGPHSAPRSTHEDPEHG